MNYLIWGVAISLLIWLILSVWNTANICNEQVEINRLLRKIDRELENCCECNEKVPDKNLDTIPKAPEANCRVHFAGTLISDEFVDGHISKIYSADDYSEYVGGGFYSKCKTAFPKADYHSFDGIAVDKGTRLIIYSEPNFKGKVLIDIVGPAIMNNELFKNDFVLGDFIHKKFSEPLESNYPQSCRKWSPSNMRNWSNGSCKIICDK